MTTVSRLPNPGHTLLPTFPSFRPMGTVGKACLPSNAYYLLTPGYTFYSGLHDCWSEHSESPFVYGFMSLDYSLGTMTTTTLNLDRGKQYGASYFKDTDAASVSHNLPHPIWFWTIQRDCCQASSKCLRFELKTTERANSFL